MPYHPTFPGIFQGEAVNDEIWGVGDVSRDWLSNHLLFLTVPLSKPWTASIHRSSKLEKEINII